MRRKILYAIHTKYGCIKKIPDYAAGWTAKEWVVFDHFPTEKDYFESVKQFLKEVKAII